MYKMEKKIISTKFLNNVIDLNDYNRKTILIESGTGTGKTTTVCEYLKDKSFISLVLLQTLGEQQLVTFKDNGLNASYYKDENKDLSGNIITTLHSLNKIIMNTSTEDIRSIVKDKILFIDEVSLFAYGIIGNSTLKKDLKFTYSALKVLINYCKQVIVCQSEIDENAMILLQSRKGTSIFIKNEYKKYEGLVATQCNDENDFIGLMKKDVKKNKYFCLALDSLTKANMYYNILKNEGENDDDFLLLTSETKVKIDQGMFKNKFIIYSPSVCYGVDITLDEKQNMYQYIGGNSIDDSLIFQQSMRIRNLSKLYYYCNAHPKSRKYTTINEVDGFYRELQHTDVMAECSYLNEHDEVEINNQSSYYKLFINVMFNKDRCFSNILEHYEARLKNSGFKLSQTGEKKTIDKELKIKTTAIIKEQKEDKFERFVEAVDKNTLEFAEYYEKMQLLNLRTDTELKKYKQEIVNKFAIEDHYNFMKILSKEEEATEKLRERVKHEYKIEVADSNAHKIAFIKRLELKYNLSVMDLSYEDREVKFDKDLYETGKKLFRIREKEDSTPKNHIELIQFYVQCIKHVVGLDIFEKKEIHSGFAKKKRQYSIDDDVLQHHVGLYGLRNKDLYDKLEQPLIEKLKLRTFVNLFD